MEKSDSIDKYYLAITSLLKRIYEEERVNIEKAADVLVKAIKEDRLIHVFGTGGHSAMGAEEMFYRAGGLVPINPILDPGIVLHFGGPRSTDIERLPGYCAKILHHYNLKEGDPIIIVTAYGINACTIDAALEAKKMGLTVIAVTSPEFSKNIPLDHPARHPTKKNLFEVADIVIDCKMPFGDAVVEIEGLQQKVAPVSTILNAFILNLLVAKTVEKLVKEGVAPPIWMSSNIPGGDEFNRKWLEKYRNRIKLIL